MRLRSSDPNFVAPAERWWRVLLPRIAPLLYGRGGPIVMVQVVHWMALLGFSRLLSICI